MSFHKDEAIVADQFSLFETSQYQLSPLPILDIRYFPETNKSQASESDIYLMRNNEDDTELLRNHRRDQESLIHFLLSEVTKLSHTSPLEYFWMFNDRLKPFYKPLPKILNQTVAEMLKLTEGHVHVVLYAGVSFNLVRELPKWIKEVTIAHGNSDPELDDIIRIVKALPPHIHSFYFGDYNVSIGLIKALPPSVARIVIMHPGTPFSYDSLDKSGKAVVDKNTSTSKLNKDDASYIISYSQAAKLLKEKQSIKWIDFAFDATPLQTKLLKNETPQLLSLWGNLTLITIESLPFPYVRLVGDFPGEFIRALSARVKALLVDATIKAKNIKYLDFSPHIKQVCSFKELPEDVIAAIPENVEIFKSEGNKLERVTRPQSSSSLVQNSLWKQPSSPSARDEETSSDEKEELNGKF